MSAHPGPRSCPGDGRPAGPLTLGPDQRGATLPTTWPLVESIAALRADCRAPGTVLVLLAATVSNAAEVADVHGSSGLEEVTGEIARRMLEHGSLQARVLRASPFGGFLAAVVVERDLARAQVEQLLGGMRRLVDVGDDQVWPVVTVGAAVCEDDDEIWSVVRAVRGAMGSAGRGTPGATRWHVGEPGNDDGAATELDRVRDLARAIAHDPAQFAVHYQPIHDLRTSTVVGAEALLRWTHPLHGPVPAILAIEAAERTGLIVPLGRLVLTRALTQVAAWRGRLGSHFRLHVNVSPLELCDPSYVGHVEATLDRLGVSPGTLLLEITESALLVDEPAVHDTLRALHDLGVGLGIDDFGTGYSSIAHLHHLPVDTVKVDRSLVSGVADEPSDFLLTRAVLGLVATLGVTVVVEGIESALEEAHLRSMGCTYGQGYHLGRPMPPEAFACLDPHRAHQVG